MKKFAGLETRPDNYWARMILGRRCFREGTNISKPSSTSNTFVSTEPECRPGAKTESSSPSRTCYQKIGNLPKERETLQELYSLCLPIRLPGLQSDSFKLEAVDDGQWESVQKHCVDFALAIQPLSS